MITRILLLPLIVMAVSCGRGREEAGSVRRFTEGDTLVVVNPPPSESSTPAFRLERDLVIGVAEGEDPYILSYITSIAADEEGRIYVGDWTQGEIRVFSPEGKFIRRFGRKGHGPGEFHSSDFLWFGIYPTADGIAVEDIPSLVVFDREGRYRETFDFNVMQLSVEFPGSLRGPLFWFPELERILTYWSRSRGRTEGDDIWFRIFSEDLTQRKVLGPYYTPAGAYYLPEGGGFSLPFASDFEWTTTGRSMLVFGFTGQYQIYYHDLSEGSWLRADMQTDPEPVYQAELEIFKERFPQRPEWTRALRNAPYPSVKPFYGRLVGDDIGRVWAEDYTLWWADEPKEVYRYDVFSADGIYLGYLETPAVITHIRDDYVYLRGSNEYPTVERYRLLSY